MSNYQTGSEKDMFNNNQFIVRLAEEAAMHNVSVNVIGLPFNRN